MATLVTMSGDNPTTPHDAPSAPSNAEAALRVVGVACLIVAALCAVGVWLFFVSPSRSTAPYSIAISMAGSITALVSAVWAFAAAQALAYLRRADDRATAAEIDASVADD